MKQRSGVRNKKSKTDQIMLTSLLSKVSLAIVGQ